MYNPLVLENIEKSITCRVPLYKVLYLTLLSLVKEVGLKRSKVIIGLPLGLKVSIPLEIIGSTWSNILHIFYYPDYEVLKIFRPRPGWVVVDVGAFIGLYTLKAARLVGNNGIVVSLEPFTEHYTLLRRNLALNSLHNVIPLRLGLAGSSGTRRLYITKDTINSTIVRGYAERMGGVEKIEIIRVISLEYLLNILKLKRVDLLKLDVEGAELEVLKGSEGILRRGIVKRIIVETHKEITDIQILSRTLEKLGFNVLIYSDAEAPLQEFIFGIHRK